MTYVQHQTSLSPRLLFCTGHLDWQTLCRDSSSWFSSPNPAKHIAKLCPVLVQWHLVGQQWPQQAACMDFGAKIELKQKYSVWLLGCWAWSSWVQILRGCRCEGFVRMKTGVEGWCVGALNTFLGFYIIHKRSVKRSLCIKMPTRKQLPSLRRTLKDQWPSK